MSDDHVTLPDDEPHRPGDDDPVEGTPDGAAAEPVVPTCAECGHGLEEDQPYCLECGAPTPSAPKLRRRIGPAGILAIGLLALGVGAGALAYAIAKEDDTTAIGTATIPTISTSTGLPPIGTTPTFPTEPTSSVDVTGTTTGGLPPFPTSTELPTTTFFPTSPTGVTTFTSPTTTATTSPPTTTSTTTTAPTTTSTTTTTTTPTTPVGADSWPDGTSGWTVILASTTSQSDATAFRSRVQATGRSAGLIQSSLYATLEPEYWVVFSGVYTSRTQAISQAATLRRTYAGAYAQRIEEA
jgi:cell division septation protein DedD